MSNLKLLLQTSGYSVLRKCTLLCLFLGMGWSLWAQQPTITVRFANPQYNCNTGEYCLDVEFQSNTTNQSLFGMNVRFFYDDSVLEFVNFRNFQGGYSAVAPNPPIINTGNSTSAATLFNLTGAAEFINGAVQLTNESVPAIVISTSGWTKLFQVCFTVDNAGANPGNFCPSVIWDLISPSSGPGFLAGDDGVVITVVDPSPLFDSAPAIENVAQFNWNDDPSGSTMPYGSPSASVCVSTICTGNLVVTKKDSLELGPNGILNVGDIISYKIKVTNNGNVAVSNVTLTDPNADAGSLSCSATTLAPGESMNCTATHTITQTDITNGSVTNTATATGVSNGNNISDPSDDPDDPTDVDPDNDGDPDDPTTTLLPTVQPVITARFSNAQYNCQTSQYCLDVEYKSNTAGQSIFGSNVRFWYDDSKLEFAGFSDFQGGYGPFSPNPPEVTTFGASTGTAFGFTGMPEFVNGAIQLQNPNAAPIILSTSAWTKIFKVCFTVDDLSNPSNFCPAVVWDLEENPLDGGFITGSDGVVITVVSANPNLDSDPAVENVAQFNWAYDGVAGTPFGAPQQTSCTSLQCCIVPIETVLNASICAGASYSFNGQTYTTAGTYTATLTAANGCDSVVTLNLTVKPKKATTLNESICAGASYSFNGQTYTTAGTYTATLTAANGCDSVVTLNLQVVPEIRKTLNESICQGASYNFNGQTLTAAGTYTATFKASGGCDSIVTLNLTVKPKKATTLNETICQGVSYSFNGQTLTASGTYNATLTAANGCDSVVTLNLQVKPTKATTLNESICAGDSYTFNGQTYTTAGTYTATLTAANGCDSVVTLNLTIQPRATVEAGEPKTIFASCLGSGSGSVTLSGSSIGGSANSATWSITNQPLGGDGALSGAGPDANPADASFSASVPGTYVLTLTTNDPAGPCPAVRDQLTVIVTAIGSQKVECLACMSQVRVSLDQNCRFLVTPAHVLEGFRDCSNGSVLKDALEVLISDGNNDSYVDCAGTYDYIVRVKKEYADCIEFASCWGKIIAEDKTGPHIVCEDWIKEPLECYDVNYVLNNHLTIGKVGATSSPRPSVTSNRTIANAEGIADAGACSLKPANLVNDNVKNLGYTFFADACQACGCRTTVKWDDRVVYYNCEQMKTNGGIYARIYRTWVATDCNGMTKDTVQEINFKRPAVEDFSFNGTGEGKYDRAVTYNACSPDKSLIKKIDVTPAICSYFNTTSNPRCLFIDQVECNYSVQIKDTEFPVCNGKGLKIDREMYIFDWCAGGIVDTLHILIKIGDFEAPSLEYAHHSPNVLSTGPMDCSAAFPISAAGIKSTFGVAVTDNCGVANVSVQVKTKDRYVKGILVAENTWEQVEYAVMNGLMTGLPVGRHRLIINVYDGCFNAMRDSFEFEVQDKIAPVMVCDDQLTVSLSNANGYTRGYAQVVAADVDEGSRDNCKLEWIRVRRNVPDNCSASFIAKGYDSNGNGKLDPMPADGDWTKADGFDINGDGDLADFGETFILKDGKLLTPLQEMVEFFCCDVAEKVTVELWGEDASGNRNFCWKEVQLEDKVAPTCIAPWDVTIDCDDKNLASIDDRAASSAIWGDVTISSGDDCAALNIEYRTVKSLKCGAGWIDRIWTMTKQTAKGPITITCKQRITIRAIREYNICFPKDAVSDCKTPIIDTVLVDELACDILAVNITDKRYDASDGECYKIFRTYTVIDWCAYDDRCGDPMTEGSVYVVNRATFENYGKAPIYVLVRDKDRNGTEEFYLSKDLVPNNSGDQAFTPPYCEASGEFYHSFMYTQIIKVYDNERPVVSGKRDTFCTDAAACSANITKVVTIKDNCTDKVELERGMLMIAPFQTLDAGKMIMYATPRWSVKELGNGQFEIKVSNLPEGLHDLIVVGRDECGNLSTATRIPFVVKDCKAPAPICINGLSTELMPDGNGRGMMAVWAKDFVASAIYDCNGQGPETKDGLKVITKYSINRVGEKPIASQTSLNLTCADAGKLILVELHAWDEAGNHDFCVTYVEVQDNRNICPGSIDAGEISGVITTDDLKPVLGVNVDLSGGAQMNQNTGSNGVYLFGNLTKGSDYTVSPQLDKDHINGVSTFDLVFIQKHILGTKAIDNPYRMIAADVNNSKSISTLDMILIRKLILNIDTKFGNVPSWKFIDATYKFPDPTNPWAAQFPEVVNVNDLDGKVKADFIAIKMGDVSGNASTSGAVAVETRSDKAMIITTDEQQLQKGENYTIVFKAKDLAKIQGYQFTLSIDPSLASIEGIDYNGVMKADNFGIFTQNGMITTSFVRAPLAGAGVTAEGQPLRGDEILFTLKLKAESNTALSRALHLNSRLTNMEAYNQSDEVMGVQLTFGSGTVADRAALRQNVPNPFSEETAVNFYLTQAAKAVLTIRDVKGALIYRVEGNYAKGSNQLILKQEQLKASGVLYYTLETADFTDTKKMVLLKR